MNMQFFDTQKDLDDKKKQFWHLPADDPLSLRLREHIDKEVKEKFINKDMSTDEPECTCGIDKPKEKKRY